MKHNTTFNGKNYFLTEISDILIPKKCFHKTQTIPYCQFEKKLLKKNSEVRPYTIFIAQKVQI